MTRSVPQGSEINDLYEIDLVTICNRYEVVLSQSYSDYLPVQLVL